MPTRTSRLIKQEQEIQADYELFAVVSCNLGRSYNPGPGTGASGRFADVFSVGTAVIVPFDAEGTGVRNRGSRPESRHMLLP